MSFVEHTVKGVERYMADDSLPFDRLRMHISELEPGKNSHPPHTHDGVEAFYVLEGEGTLEIDGQPYVIRAHETMVIDPTRLHGLTNTGSTRMRYVVMMARDV